ncbi:MAG: hypothetical protein IJH48_05865 [Oscillospiraceae bacterium]|nr:hypothetical protein [Oscillospiraceae bacterium]
MKILSSLFARAALGRLVKRNSRMTWQGFAIDLRGETKRWDRAIRTLGAARAYRLMSAALCKAYRRRYGRDFLFTERCVAKEIAYHANAYFWTQGYAGYMRHLTTLLFDRRALEKHCGVVDVFTYDTGDARQRLMFGYVRGVRRRYRNTAADPFVRGRLFSRLKRRS